MDPERPSQHAFFWPYGVWILGVFAFFVPAATWSPVSRFALTRAIVEEHTFSIDTNAASTGDRARRDGHWYTDKAPVPSLLAVPAYAAMHGWNTVRGHAPRFTAVATPDMPAKRVYINRTFQQSLYVCSVATAGLAGMLLALGVFELVRRRSAPVAALVGSELVVLATPLLPYATSFYGHVVAGAALIWAVCLLSRAPPPGRTATLVSGALLVTAVGSEYLITVPAAAVAAWFVLAAPREDRARVARHLLLGGAGPGLVIAAYHVVCFGAPWRTGYSFITIPHFAAGHASGFLGVRLPSLEAIWGLTFGARRGLFYIAPVALPSLVGLVLSAVRDKDPIARLGLVCIGLLGWLNSSYYMWWGGAAAGPRHLVPVFGFLALGIAYVWRRPGWRALVVVLGMVSLANTLVITAVGLEAPEFDDVLRRYAWPAFLDGKLARLSGASSFGLRLGLRGWTSLWPLAVWLVVGQIYVLRALRASTHEATATDDRGGRQGDGAA